jgi:FkbM family methyltransferase
MFSKIKRYFRALRSIIHYHHKIDQILQAVNSLSDLVGWGGQYSDMHLFFWCKKYWRDRFIQVADNIGHKQHQANVDALFSGLQEDAKQNLIWILDLLERFSRSACFSYSDLFLGEDWSAFRKYEEFKKSIRREDGYWQYKNYKLPAETHFYEIVPSVFLYQHGINQLKTFELIADKVIIDVGAFICDSALLFHSLAPNNPVISFEPDPDNFTLAHQTLELNNISSAITGGGGVIVENIALGGMIGMIEFISEKSHAGSSHILSSMILNDSSAGKNKIRVPMDTLDNYVRQNKLEVGLIKTDLEGYEWNFLQGALETIKSQRPILLISIYHSYDDFYKIKPFIESLNLGYKFNFFYGIHDVPWSDILLLCEVY